MSVNLNPKSSSSTVTSQPIDENIATETIPDQGSSPFDTIPDETLQKILEFIPQMRLNKPDIGPYKVSKRFNGASKAVFRKKTFKSPTRKAPLPVAELLRAPMKKRRPSNFSRKVTPFNLDKIKNLK